MVANRRLWNVEKYAVKSRGYINLGGKKWAPRRGKQHSRPGELQTEKTTKKVFQRNSFQVPWESERDSLDSKFFSSYG